MLALSLRFHARARSGDLLNRLIGDVGKVQDVAVTAALPLAGNIITLVGMTVVMLWLDPWLAAVLLAALPLFFVTSSRQSRRITTAARDQRQREGELAGTVAETLGAIHVVQSYGLERELGRQFGASNAGSLRDGVRGARLSAGLERKTDLLVGLATAVVLFAGGSRLVAGQLSAGELIVFLNYLKSAFKPLRDLAKYTGRLAKAAASGERILDLADQTPDVAERLRARRPRGSPGPCASRASRPRGTAGTSSCATSTSTCRRAAGSAWSAGPAPASPRWSACSSGCRTR